MVSLRNANVFFQNLVIFVHGNWNIFEMKLLPASKNPVQKYIDR